MTASAYSAYGLVLSSDRQRTGLGESVYQKAARRGELIRIRRGAYCESSHWAGLSPRQRYLLRIRATVLASSRPLVLCGFSAAAVWGMPTLDGWPSQVHVLGEHATGGRSKNGVTRHPVAATVQHIEERDNLLVTGVARTALDVTLVLEFPPAVATLDWALWRHNQLRVGLDEVREELRQLGPRYRKSHADAVLDFATHL